ncbi:MAG: alpha/beta hydrolase [Psychromonas sp.]|nr:alpha/beta hydrolase [Psychromonas sp.]
MLKISILSILIILMVGCSSPNRELDTTQPQSVEVEVAKHWQISYFNEPVFNSNVAVLETGEKDKPAIILIHGLGQLGMKDWFTVIPILEKNYHVIAIDLPGFGSSVPAKGRFLPSNYARVIAAINVQYNGGKAIVIGHSMGAAVALRYSEMYTDQVKQLIMIDAAGILEKSAFIKHIATFEYGDDSPIFVQKQIELLNEFSSSLVEAGTKSTAVTDYLQGNDRVWDWLTADSSNMNAALSLVDEEFSQAVNQLTIPVDIIWGDKDKIAPLRTGKVLNKQMQTARLHIINGASHVPMKTHHKAFIDALQLSITTPIPETKPQITTGLSQGKLNCQGQSNKTYSGHYDEIVITGCDDITLKNISTNRLYIKGSVVDIENLNFVNADNQLVFKESIVTMTNADISGHNTMLVSGSRLDMAGISFDVTGVAVQVANGSRISVSLSDIKSPQYTGVIHGAFYLKNQSLVKQYN